VDLYITENLDRTVLKRKTALNSPTQYSSDPDYENRSGQNFERFNDEHLKPPVKIAMTEELEASITK